MTRVRIIVYSVSILIICLLFLFGFGKKEDEVIFTNVDPSEDMVAENTSTTTSILASTTDDKIIRTTTTPSQIQTPQIKSVTETQEKEDLISTPEKPKSEPTFDYNLMLSAHNIIRKNVGIAPLIYSKTLAEDAQLWSQKLKEDGCEMKHDPNTPYGENLYWVELTGDTTDNLIETPKAIVTAWAEEKNYYNYEDNTCDKNKQCGHYTQLVWEDTTEVGCGVSVCFGKNSQKEIWVCRYNPAGNYIGEKPY